MALSRMTCEGCEHPFSAEQIEGDLHSVICSNCGRPYEPRRRQQLLRRRGTAIVDTPKGILVVAGKRRRFMLPGGGARKGESRRSAAIRELREETGLWTTSCQYLFSYNSPHNNRRVRNLHKVFLIEAYGEPRPDNHEVRYVGYWNHQANLYLNDSAKVIIDRYLGAFKRQTPPPEAPLDTKE